MKTATSIERIRPRFLFKTCMRLFYPSLLALPVAVQAGEYWLKTAVAAPISVPANWTNSVGVAPSAINADDILHIVKSEAVALAGTGRP